MATDQITLAAVGLIFLKEAISLFFNSNKEHAKALQENTLALTRLQVEMSHLQKGIDQLPKIRGDVDAAHNKLRELSAIVHNRGKL